MRTRQRPPHITTLVAIGAFVLTPLVTAQEPAAPRFDDTVEVSEILLDVVAVDRKGQPIRDLGIEDFLVLEEGQPVDVTSVSYYTTRYDAGDDPSAAAGEIPSSRYFVLVFHDTRRLGASAGRLVRQQLEAGRESARWVREEMGPSDWVAVAGYDVKLSLHQDFTQDRGALELAIDAAVRGKKARILPPSERQREVARGPALLAGLPAGPDLGRETPRIYDALRLLAEASGPLVGRKNVLLFTIGFGTLDTSTPFARPDPRFYPPMVEALNANNVAVYPIDLTPVGVEHSNTNFLNQLAQETGGRYLFNFTSFMTPIRRTAEENTGYYGLSYRTQHAIGEAGYREVTVRANRKGIVLHARRGYRFGDHEASR